MTMRAGRLRDHQIMAVGAHCQMLPDEELVFWLASAHLAPREVAMILQATVLQQSGCDSLAATQKLDE